MNNKTFDEIKKEFIEWAEWGLTLDNDVDYKILDITCTDVVDVISKKELIDKLNNVKSIKDMKYLFAYVSGYTDVTEELFDDEVFIDEFEYSVTGAWKKDYIEMSK